MYKLLIIFGSIICLCFYFYGIFFKIFNTEKNECKMTYMFEYPHFEKINFPENINFPKYGLYGYAEGVFIQKLQAKIFDGGPVIFIPGNGGSYKQVRSLASVALRKAIKIRWKKHLDYFSVDLNEEYSGIFGGYLDQQKCFVKLCILTILNLYKNLKNRPTDLIVIGHSMGGKIAQSLLTDDSISKYINTIITLATPIDEPVMNNDPLIDSFYNKINDHLFENRTVVTLNNETNHCQNTIDIKRNNQRNMILDDKLLISIGGGIRDYLVHGGLTSSKYSDINVLTTSIPNVWLSTDHLCAVWCLQLVLVINRFLFSLISSEQNDYKTGINFIQDKSIKLKNAEQFFSNSIKFLNDENILKINPENIEWYEDSRRTFVENFPSGINKIRVQMIRLLNDFRHVILSVRTVNINVENWIFGCSATEVAGTKRVCSNITSLSYVIEKLPPVESNNHFVTIDLEKIRENRPQWTHILLYMRPSKRKMKLYVDIYGRGDRSIAIRNSNWLQLNKITMFKKTISSVHFYKLLLPDLHDVYQVLKLIINPINCPYSNHQILAKLCVPWTEGCNIYYLLKDTNNVLIYATSTMPDHYNSSENPISVDLHLDSGCIYDLSVENSVGGMASQVVQQYFNRIPSYVVITLIIILQSNITRISSSTSMNKNMCLNFIPSKKSLFLIFATSILSRYLSWFDNYIRLDKNQSIFISLILMGIVFAVVLISFTILWLTINLLIRILRLISKIKKMNYIVSNEIILYFSLTTVLILLSLISCGGFALICACFMYTVFITTKYEKLLALKSLKSFSKESEKELQNSKNSNKCMKEQTKEENILYRNEQQNQLHNFNNVGIESEIDILLKKASFASKDNRNIIYTKNFDKSLNIICIHMSLLMIVVALTFLNLPSTITWIKNIKFTKVLNPDPSLRPSILLLISLFWIWLLPLPGSRNFRYISWIFDVCIIFCTLYCQHSVFLLNIVINFVFILISISQMLM